MDILILMITLPKIFKSLLWSYKFKDINPEGHQRIIVVNAVNYGDLEHWRWLFHYYGKPRLKRIIANIPSSEFRPSALKLAALLLGLTTMKYASRSSMVSGQTAPVEINRL